MINIKEEKSFNSHDGTVYVDMDGVLANFHGYFKQLFGWDLPKGDADKKPELDQKMWKQINDYGKSRFFEELPWIEGSKTVWNFLVDNFINVKILSALGKSNASDDLTRKGKMAWLNENIPKLLEKDIILVANKHKKRHYSKPNDIIIDDTPVVIEEWNNRGGIGIFFTDAKSVIQKLEKFVYEEDQKRNEIN